MDIWFAIVTQNSFTLIQIFEYIFRKRTNPLGWGPDWNVTKFWDKQPGQRQAEAN